MDINSFIKPICSYHPDLPANGQFDGKSIIHSIELDKRTTKTGGKESWVIIEHFLDNYRAVERWSPKYYAGENQMHLCNIIAHIIKDNGGDLSSIVIPNESKEQDKNKSVPPVLYLAAALSKMIAEGKEIKVPMRIERERCGQFRKFIYYPEGVANER